MDPRAWEPGKANAWVLQPHKLEFAVTQGESVGDLCNYYEPQFPPT